MKFIIKALLATILAGFVLCWLASQMMPSTGSHVDRNNVPLDSFCPLRELPRGATNVSYHYGGGRNPNTFYEFDIDESDFDDWIAKLTRFKSRSDSNVVYRFSAEQISTQMLTIADGAVFDWQDPNDGDHGEHIGYNRKTGRCYYQYHRF